MDHAKRLSVGALALALWLVPLTARATTACAVVLRELNAVVEPGVFLEGDREAIDLWYRSGELGPKETAQKVFDLFLERRLALLTPDQAEKVRNILKKRVSELDVKEDWEERDWMNDSPGMLASKYAPGEQWIYLWSHKQYKASEAYFHVLVHEAEHAIQDVVMKERGIERSQPTFWNRWFARHRLLYEHFLFERQAMTAEWAFSRAIPESRRRELADRIEKDTELTPQERRSLVRWLTNASLPLKDYLAREYEGGRYAPPEVRNRQVRRALDKILATGTTSALGALLAIAIAESQCAGLFANAGDEYYSGLCKRFQ